MKVAVPPPAGQRADEAPAPGARDRMVWLTGRVDRLERRPDGRVVIVDFKTAATKVTRAQAADHPQLSVYQVAVELGAFDELLSADASTGEDPDRQATDTPDGSDRAADGAGGPSSRSGGAELVYLRSGRPQVLEQPPLDPERGEIWQTAIRAAARTLAVATLPAVENARCDRCPVRGSCPVRPEGRQVTR